MDLENTSAAGAINCMNCQTVLASDDVFCGKCGFPERGTEEEQRNYRLKIASRKRLLKSANKKVKNGKTVLYVLAGLNVLAGIIEMVRYEDIAALVASLVLAVIYLVLAAWSDKQPFAAILTGFIIYITIQLLSVILDPINILSGIVLKIIIITVFIKGIKSAREAQDVLKELEFYKH